MNLNHLYYFRALAKEEHYTRTADMLSITQPSLSHAISCLESELGRNYLKNRGRNAKLGESWSIVFTLCGEVAGYVDEGKRVVTETSEPAVDLLIWGISLLWGSHFYSKSDQRLSGRKREESYSFSFGQERQKKIVEELKRWEI